MTCSMAVFEPSTTIVRREMWASWVRPMVKLSIANPRCRNRLTTRFSVHGASSTVATNVCFIRNNLRQGGTRHNHRVHAFFTRDLELDQVRSREVHRGLNRAIDLIRMSYSARRNAVGLGQLHEVGVTVVEHDRLIVGVVEQLLPLAHHAQRAIVEE